MDLGINLVLKIYVFLKKDEELEKITTKIIHILCKDGTYKDQVLE